jgi:ABC-type transporter Mla subunit MlaD
MTDATRQATELLKRLNDLLNDENRKNMSDMLTALSKMSRENTAQMRLLLQNANSLTENLNRTVVTVNGMIGRNDSTLQQSMAQLQRFLAESQSLAEHMNRTLSSVDQTMLQNSESLRQVLHNSERLTRNLQEFSQNIKEQPWSLIRKEYPLERKLP